MLKNFIETPPWKFLKRYKILKEINKFAKQHSECCDIKFKNKYK